jgi:hypothetical protein
MRFSTARLRRRFGIRPLALGLLATGAAQLLIWLHDLVESAQWLKKEMFGLNHYLIFIVRLFLSPAFYTTISFAVTVYLIVKVAMAPISGRTESFIETTERWIASGRKLSKTSISQASLAAWQTRAELELIQYLGRASGAIDTFKREGTLLPTDFERGEEGIRSALKRQMRVLKELIDRADRGELKLDPDPLPRFVV